jgi:hypothetical protein
MNKNNNPRQVAGKDIKKIPVKEELRSVENTDVDFKTFLQGMAKTMTENLKSKDCFNR